MYSYNDQVEHLKQHPEDILPHWNSARGIFKIVGARMHEDGRTIDANLSGGGCLTMIKIGANAVIDGIINEVLTEKIREDDRIPSSPSRITTDHLEVFKEYQEYADSLIK